MAIEVGIEEQTPSPASTGAGSELQEQAKRHLWMHFTRMGAYDDHEVPVIVRGEGCYVWDEHGKRYLDGLSALFCVNAGHGRAELAEAAGARRGARLLHELELRPPAARSSSPRGSPRSRPGDLNRVFFTSGGSEAVESALKLARNYHRLRGEGSAHEGHRARARLPRHHARRAVRHRPDRRCARRSSRSRRAAATCPNTNSYRWPEDRDPLWAADAIEERIEFEGPGDGRRGDPRAGPERGRLLRPAGGLLPARARDLRPPRRAADLRRGDLLVGPARPLLRLRALRLPARHHHDREGPHLRLRRRWAR